MNSLPIVIEVRDALAIVQFNRPAQRNPFSTATLQDLDRITTSLFARADISGVIVTGTEDVFASGADIRELAQLHPQTASKFSGYGQAVFQKIAEARQVTIAAINGYCMGGALDLALACDIRVASAGALFAHPGAKLGIITGWGGTQRLPRVIGRARALEFFATARRYTSDAALEIGLITRIGDPVLECAIKCAQQAGVVG